MSRFGSRAVSGILSALVFVALGIQLGEADVGHAAGWWRQIPRSAAPVVIDGAISAYKSGWAWGVIEEDKRLRARAASHSETLGRAVADLTFETTSSNQMASLANTPRFSATNAYYRGAIDNFYASIPGGATVDFGDALACHADAPPIACTELGLR